jgi:hypothetical protein
MEQGLFKVGEEWLTLEQANEAHSTMESPWELDGNFSSLVTTCNHDFAQKALIDADRAIQKAYSVMHVPVPEDFPKVQLMMVNDVENYKQIGQAPQDNADAAMSSNYECFSFQDPNAARYIGVILFTVLDENNPEGNENFTRFLVRHAATEAAVRNMEMGEEVPRWFVTGLATYTERYWDPFYENGVVDLARWSCSALTRDGGVLKLDSFFEPFTVTRQTVLQSGLVLSYLLHGQDLPGDVQAQWDKVRNILASDDRKDLAKEFLKLETVMTAKAEEPMLMYMDSLLQG